MNSVFSEQDFADSLRPYFEQKQPVVLRSAVAAAPAIKLWGSIEYWMKTVGPNEMAHAEIGGAYSSFSTDRAEIPIHDYLQYLEMFAEHHGTTGPADPHERPTQIPVEELVYMAQNDLPHELHKDVSIPKLCDDESYNVGDGRLYSTMLWLGPRGCFSPLHQDPLDNLLMQFVGRKFIWMFEPQPGGWHYAGHDGQQPNTSPVNPEDDESLAKYNLFVDAGPPATQCILKPGDVLFIPKKWWHYVRSLDASASVNAWWR